jgi:hypothetical protein
MGKNHMLSPLSYIRKFFLMEGLRTFIPLSACFTQELFLLITPHQENGSGCLFIHEQGKVFIYLVIHQLFFLRYSELHKTLD